MHPISVWPSFSFFIVTSSSISNGRYNQWVASVEAVAGATPSVWAAYAADGVEAIATALDKVRTCSHVVSIQA